MNTLSNLMLSAALVFSLAGCGGSSGDGEAGTPAKAGDGMHADDRGAEPADTADHAHDETSLGSAMVGDLEVEFAQGHGAVEAGKEGHLVVKLPYSDNGATTVRAWIGGADRTLSFVGKGTYAPSHDDYDIHAMAPDPLPENVSWWVELEKPDGTKIVGSVKPKLE